MLAGNDEATMASFLIAPDTRCSFLHNQTILYGFDPTDAFGDFTRFIDGLLGIN